MNCCRNGREGEFFNRLPGRKMCSESSPEGPERASLGHPGDTEPQAQACCRSRLYPQLEVRWPSEKEFRNISYHFGFLDFLGLVQHHGLWSFNLPAS